jgi:hypothetical protein
MPHNLVGTTAIIMVEARGVGTLSVSVGYPGIFLGGGGGVSTNSVKDRGQREWGSGCGSPLVRGSAQFANE